MQKALYGMINQASGALVSEKTRSPTLGRCAAGSCSPPALTTACGRLDRCGLYFGWQIRATAPFLSTPFTADSVINGRETLCVQDRYNYDVGDKITAIHTCLDKQPRSGWTPFSLNFTSHERQRRWGTRREYCQGHQSWISTPMNGRPGKPTALSSSISVRRRSPRRSTERIFSDRLHAGA